MFGRKRASAPVADGLDARARRRLERFVQRFDGISADDLTMFAGPATPDEPLQAAMDAANDALRGSAQRDATKDAVQTFVRAAQQRYSDDFSILALLGVGSRGRLTASDRMRVFQSLERSVVALVLWDRLDDETRTALAGPWAELVEAAVEGQ